VGAIVLDPHLAVADVDVNDRAVDAPVPLPAHLHHLVVVVLAVHDGFCADVTAGRLVAGVFLDQAADDFPVSVQVIHRTTLSCFSSKTRSRKRKSPPESRRPGWAGQGSRRPARTIES